MRDRIQLGRIIKAGRVLQGLRQPELAGRVGISLGHLSHIERGACRPSRRLLMRLSAVLSLPGEDKPKDAP